MITRLKISDIKLGTQMLDSGAPLSRCAAFFIIGEVTLKTYIQAYKDGEVLISHDDIIKAADGDTINNAHIKLKSMGLDKSIKWLQGWCRDHDVKYLSMCRREAIISDKKEQEILSMLHEGHKQSSVAELCGVSVTTVFRVAKRNGVKNKHVKELSKETLSVIEFLFEAANLHTKKEIVKSLGISKLKVRSAMQTIINHPADYELIKSSKGVEMSYKIAAVSSKRKSKMTNEKRRKVIQMLNGGHEPERVAEQLKCKVDTVNSIKASTGDRVKMSNPDMSPMMALALGMKVK